MEKIKIGKIVNAVGLKGEVKVYNYSDRLERYEELERVIIDGRPVNIKGVRYKGNMIILKLAGVDDRNAAEAMKDKEVFITEDDLVELPEDTFYVRDLIGLDAVKGKDANFEKFGIIEDVIQNTAQDLYKIKTLDGKEILVPAVKAFVEEVNLEEGYVKINVIEGMID